MIDYPGATTTMGVREARDQLASLIQTAHTQPVIIERHGQPVAVVISPKVFQELHDAWEDLEDLKEVEDFESTDDGVRIPLEEVMSDLGWS